MSGQSPTGSIIPKDDAAAASFSLRRRGFNDGRAGKPPAERDQVYMHSYKRGLEERERSST